MDTVIQIIATGGPVVLALMGLYVSIWPPMVTGKIHWVWISAFAIVGVIATMANFIELHGSDATQREIKAGVDQLLGHKITEAELYFGCDWTPMPKTMPASGEIYVYEPHALDALTTLKTFGGASLGRQFGPPGAELKWSADDKLAAGEKCQLFNYGTGPIFNVLLTFDVALRNVINNGGGAINTSDLVESGQWQLPISKIDEGRSNPFEFYFLNRAWPYFIQISPTPSVSFLKNNGGQRLSAVVISAERNNLIFLNPGGR
jgi:hypothetical protein